MLFEKKASALRIKILDSFSDFPVPEKNQVAPHDCCECNELRETFAGLDWKRIDKQIIEENFSQIPLFSPEAYHYFLPAFLLYVLDNFAPSSLVLEFTLYALCPSTDERMKKYWQERGRTFTKEQINILYEFLELIRAQPETHAYYQDIDKAKTGLASYGGDGND